MGWEHFTDRVISLLNERQEPMVFLLWGANARQKKQLITNPHHKILETVHPSPLSAYNGFFGCKHFSKTNDISQSVYLLTIAVGIIGAIIIVFQKEFMLFAFVPHISLIGFWMFMMIWESNHRQLVNQWSLFFIVAAIGLYSLWSVISELFQKKAKETELSTVK